MALLVSCAGSDGATPSAPLESSEPITAPPSTGSVAGSSTSTTTSSTIADTTTTSVETPETTTTEVTPSSTTLDDLRQQIEADLNAGEQALLAGAADPSNPDSVTALGDFYTGQSLAALESTYRDLAAQGHVVRPNPDVPSKNVVLEVLNVSADAVEVRRCRIDAAQIVSATDPSDVIDDEIVRYYSVSTVQRSNARWVLEGGDTISREVGPTECE